MNEAYAAAISNGKGVKQEIDMTPSPQYDNWQDLETLCCVERRQETDNAVTLVLKPTKSLAVSYLPGQFLVLNVPINGQSHSRAYSLCSAPQIDHELAVTVKRVDGGLVSNWLLDHFHVGDELAALPPAGAFVLPTDYSAKNILLCSAGSGITPMMSMARWLIAHQPDVNIHFMHSARHADDLIFKDALLAMTAQHAQFHFYPIFRNLTDAFTCYQGRINPALFDQLITDLTDTQVFMCGPEDYMETIEGFLRDRQFPMEFSHKESFTPSALTMSTPADTQTSFAISVPQFGADTEIAAHQTILDALESMQLPIIAACRSGICGSCKCKVTKGQAENISDMPGPLTEEEQQEGFILACSSRANSDLELEI